MIIRLKGNIEKLLPTSVELEVNNVTYFVEISLLTSIELQNKKETTLEIAQIIREDSNLLFGFASRQEREIFLQLLKVNGVGAKIALAILSTYSVPQFLNLVQTNNAAALKSVKGVGAKVAGKIMLDFAGFSQNVESSGSESARLAFEALLALGFKDAEINAVLSKLDSKILEKNESEIVKEVLKNMGK
ncbi:Holliday junction branch migration protein RuvA [Helicobacter saguini]|uniref:Holliday junction branch migration complex subunit RuvA n=1 Tax=Helicobacter saguini TaxID=1548018 RepID=A0A347VT42_9HELI|nr:Holliday junction branch migration protein RuvA [Helicobacter saguini]MWV62247.1 Holliday junction branch migration protein RuvA [Helicobacter saguini]MWV67080.1 Holliday junction branch migration protein RuvA [Helicobacter saguini]MWV69430.1 Holliday junction branch migration protein RuvA [Helicobacter saguini]MWV71016.1 Holliday junction branch migration protein RuvA [Helicobacter saguini]TLD91749.1 Holliday junction branch migration protein RuvA [Helicobacter saguini]